jgi:MarR family transcriptional repressor of emrRAB
MDEIDALPDSVLAIASRLDHSHRRHRDFPRSEAGLIRLFKLLHKLVNEQSYGLLREYGLTHPEYNVLIMLDGSEGGLGPGELAEASSEKASNTTRLVDQLISKGLVTRSPSDSDRRRLQVQLTGEGERLIALLLPAVAAQLRGFFAELQHDESAQLERLLGKVVRGMERATP